MFAEESECSEWRGNLHALINCGKWISSSSIHRERFISTRMFVSLSLSHRMASTDLQPENALKGLSFCRSWVLECAFWWMGLAEEETKCDIFALQCIDSVISEFLWCWAIKAKSCLFSLTTYLKAIVYILDIGLVFYCTRVNICYWRMKWRQ